MWGPTGYGGVRRQWSAASVMAARQEGVAAASDGGRNVKQLRKEAATLHKQHCRTYKMNRGQLIKFIKDHDSK